MAISLMEKTHEGWFNQERRNWIVLCVLCAVGGAIFNNGYATSTVVEAKDAVITTQGQALGKTATVAKQAVKAANCQTKRTNDAEQQVGMQGMVTALPPCPPTPTEATVAEVSKVAPVVLK